MYHGSCLCGTVKFQITGSINDIVLCHCSLCRKAQGSAFASNGNVRAHDFAFIQGENNLSTFEFCPGHFKLFCKTCGSPILSKNINSPSTVRVRLGTIESDIKEQPLRHIFTASKANWEMILGELPQYEDHGPS